MRGPDFSNVQSGSSSTAAAAGVYAYPAEVIPGFLDANADQPVEGGPFDVPGWFTGGWFFDDIVTLRDYVSVKTYPPQGVIIRPLGSSSRVLVWYDAAGVVHVIDVSGHSIANEVSKPAFESPDSSYLDNLLQRINEIAGGLPSPAAALDSITLIVGGLAVIAVVSAIRSR